MSVSPQHILDALRHVVDPDRGKDLVRLDRVKNLKVSGQTASFTIVVKNPGSDFARNVEALCTQAIHDHVGSDVQVRIETDSEMISLGDDLQVSGTGQKQQPKQPEAITNFVAVASGKGGVGKSTVAANLALGLAEQGYAVGLLDADIYGPSVPLMFGVHGERPRVDENRQIIPLERHGVKLLSMGFMVDPEKAVIWRGPMVSSAVRQFLGDAAWGELDYLVLDLPPGTGDIQLTIVSTPQDVALADARKGVAMFQNVHVPVLGIVENMAYFTPPDLPDRKYYLFGRGGAQKLASKLEVPFLGEVPIEQGVREGGDLGTPIVASEPESVSAKALRSIAAEADRQVALRNAEKPPTQQVDILHR